MECKYCDLNCNCAVTRPPCNFCVGHGICELCGEVVCADYIAEARFRSHEGDLAMLVCLSCREGR